MDWLHCNECHHEFYGKAGAKCDWCGAGSFVLQVAKKYVPDIRALAEDCANMLRRAKLN